MRLNSAGARGWGQSTARGQAARRSVQEGRRRGGTRPRDTRLSEQQRSSNNARTGQHGMLVGVQVRSRALQFRFGLGARAGARALPHILTRCGAALHALREDAVVCMIEPATAQAPGHKRRCKFCEILLRGTGPLGDDDENSACCAATVHAYCAAKYNCLLPRGRSMGKSLHDTCESCRASREM